MLGADGCRIACTLSTPAGIAHLSDSFADVREVEGDDLRGRRACVERSHRDTQLHTATRDCDCSQSRVQGSHSIDLKESGLSVKSVASGSNTREDVRRAFVRAFVYCASGTKHQVQMSVTSFVRKIISQHGSAHSTSAPTHVTHLLWIDSALSAAEPSRSLRSGPLLNHAPSGTSDA